MVQELLVTLGPPLPGLVSLLFFLFLPCPVSQPPAGMSGDGKGKQVGADIRVDPGRRLVAGRTDDTLCEAAEDSPC